MNKSMVKFMGLLITVYNTPSTNVLKNASSTYVKDMIENMILTLCLDKSYLVVALLDFHIAWRLHYTITVKRIDVAMNAFLV